MMFQALKWKSMSLMSKQWNCGEERITLIYGPFISAAAGYAGYGWMEDTAFSSDYILYVVIENIYKHTGKINILSNYMKCN